MLNIDGTHLVGTLYHRGLVEELTATQLLQNARALVLTLKLLQGALDVFALLYSRDNHSCILFFVLLNRLFVLAPLLRGEPTL